MISALPVGKDRVLVGWAMVGRGEFAFLVAEVAISTVRDNGEPMLGEDAYAVVVWALLISTVVAPFTFRWALRRRLDAQYEEIVKRKSSGVHRAPSGDNRFQIRLVTHHKTGLLHEVCYELFAAGMDVLEAFVESDGTVDVEVLTVRPRAQDGKTLLDQEKLQEVLHCVLDAVNDPSAQIAFRLPEEEDGGKARGKSGKRHGHRAPLLEIQLMAKHQRALLRTMVDTLSELDLVLEQAVETGIQDTDVDTFYVKARPNACFSAPPGCPPPHPHPTPSPRTSLAGPGRSRDSSSCESDCTRCYGSGRWRARSWCACSTLGTGRCRRRRSCWRSRRWSWWVGTCSRSRWWARTTRSCCT